jgi:ATP-dependent DNA ligase
MMSASASRFADNAFACHRPACTGSTISILDLRRFCVTVIDVPKAYERPQVVARIEYLEWMEGDHLRHSKFAGLRNDKRAQDVNKEHAGEA